jgi:two-component system, cell cycle response regulator CpdR
VLVVDGDPGVLDVVAAMLENLGCKVVIAESGRAALTLLEHNQGVAILITDINMPGPDGHKLAERAKKLTQISKSCSYPVASADVTAFR